MITPNVTGMSLCSPHAYKGLQYYNKMPDKNKKVVIYYCIAHSVPSIHSSSPLALHHAGVAAPAAAAGSFGWRQEEEGGLPTPPP
jgi:hypothetical protein